MAKLTVCVSIILVLLAALSEGSPRRFCCTEYQEHPIPVKALRSYIIQDIIEHCNIKAVIFRTKKGRFFCADPDRQWVKLAMESVPEV